MERQTSSFLYSHFTMRVSNAPFPTSGGIDRVVRSGDGMWCTYLDTEQISFGQKKKLTH
jgi:hypothetical protein